MRARQVKQADLPCKETSAAQASPAGRCEKHSLGASQFVAIAWHAPELRSLATRWRGENSPKISRMEPTNPAAITSLWTTILPLPLAGRGPG
jgi:hypothetical protein